MLIGIILSLITMGLTLWLTGRLSSPTSMLASLDHPNERSLHTRPIPRTGGIAIMAGLLAGGAGTFLWLSWERIYDETAIWILGGMLTIALFSFWDDRIGLPTVSRFVLHTIITGGVIWGGGLSIRDIDLPFIGVLSFGWFSVPLTILFLMWMTNLYNFMDGMDGFAGGMAVIGFGYLAYLGWISEHESILIMSLLIVAAAAGFLLWNFPPAKIFLGDVGSVSLGFLAGVLLLMGIRDEVFDFWVPVLIFSPFIVDATVTLFRRLLRGEKVWQAHREHYYQRLVLAGWGHKKTVMVEYGLMLACGMTAVVYSQVSELWRLIILLCWAGVYAGLIYGVSFVEKRHHGSSNSETGVGHIFFN